MPRAVIEVRRDQTPDMEMAMIEAVHAALVASFRIPPADKDVRLVVHLPHRFAVSPELTDPEAFTMVSIDCFAGRSIEAKRRLYSEIVERLSAIGIPGDHVSTIIREIPTQNWGTCGGVAACDVDLGFDLTV